MTRSQSLTLISYFYKKIFIKKWYMYIFINVFFKNKSIHIVFKYLNLYNLKVIRSTK